MGRHPGGVQQEKQLLKLVERRSEYRILVEYREENLILCSGCVTHLVTLIFNGFSKHPYTFCYDAKTEGSGDHQHSKKLWIVFATNAVVKVLTVVIKILYTSIACMTVIALFMSPFIAILAPILSSMNQVCYLLLSHSFLTSLHSIINLQFFLLHTRLLFGIHWIPKQTRSWC